MMRRKPNMTLTKTPMPEQSVEQRLTNFDEVELGYTPEQAMQEAERCLNCPDRYFAARVQREVAANGLKAAVVGGGPAGLTCALSLAESGFTVTVYEKEDHTGGIPSWGIPPLVLPCQLLARLSKQLEDQPNAVIRLNTALERDITLDELVHTNDAVFLATGAERPVELNLPGRELTQVVQARDYLTHPETYSGKRVLVIGGGNTAIDAARTAVRENADSVTLVYRRNEDAMPATQQECSIAKAEGVQLKTLRSPARFVGENGTLTGLECNIMQLTAPDYPGGRPNSAPTGETETLEADLVVLALGFENLPVAGVSTDPHNHIIIGKDFSTSVDKVYAGGDAVTGAATFMKAVAAVKDAAAAIFARLCE